MKLHLECIPCMVRQTIDAVRNCNVDEDTQKETVRKLLEYLQNIDYELTPPENAKTIYKIIGDETGNFDPYKQKRRLYNSKALKFFDRAKVKIEFSDDKLLLAAKMCAAGNVIDFGVEKKEIDINDILNEAQKIQFTIADVEMFRKEIAEAKTLLYLADNAGEIVFDKIFIEVLKQFNPELEIVVAVRGAPIINDVTVEDARQVKLDEIVKVIDNGDGAPATVLHDVSEEFLEYYNNADIILSKGQGNFETLHTENRPIYFVFKVKCPVIAKEVGVEEGSLIFKKTKKS